MLTTREAAEAIGTTAKTLRAFLRQDDTFGGVGSGAKYAIKDADLPVLKKRFTDWAGTRKAPRVEVQDVDTPGLPASVLYRNDRATRAAVQAQAEARVDRLEALLKERGLHISQMRERESFRV